MLPIILPPTHDAFQANQTRIANAKPSVRTVPSSQAEFATACLHTSTSTQYRYWRKACHRSLRVSSAEPPAAARIYEIPSKLFLSRSFCQNPETHTKHAEQLMQPRLGITGRELTPYEQPKSSNHQPSILGGKLVRKLCRAGRRESGTGVLVPPDLLRS